MSPLSFLEIILNAFACLIIIIIVSPLSPEYGHIYTEVDKKIVEYCEI